MQLEVFDVPGLVFEIDWGATQSAPFEVSNAEDGFSTSVSDFGDRISFAAVGILEDEPRTSGPIDIFFEGFDIVFPSGDRSLLAGVFDGGFFRHFSETSLSGNKFGGRFELDHSDKPERVQSVPDEGGTAAFLGLAVLVLATARSGCCRFPRK